MSAVSRPGIGQRGFAVLVALVIEALFALLFLFLTPAFQRRKLTTSIFGFNVTDTDNSPPAKAKAKAAAPHPKAVTHKQTPAAARAAAASPIPATPQAKQSGWPPNFIPMSGSAFAKSDISGIKPSPDASGDSASGQDDSQLAEGHGPHGEPLYAADWYTRPTNAQLNTYIPERARGVSGWGEVACRTVAGYRVEACHNLGESPPGSGYAEAVRQAAWQFRVRPPRVGGHYQVGTWVSIHIDYTFSRSGS